MVKTHLVAAAFLVLACRGSAEVRFSALGGQQTGLRAVLSELKTAEMARQGGVLRDWWPWGVRCIDLDNDGKSDFVVTFHSPVGSIVIKTGVGPTFSRHVTLDNRVLPQEQRPQVFDFDGDGFLDLGAYGEANSRPNVRNVNGTLTLLTGGLQRAYGKPRHIRDLNGDGKPDLEAFTRGYGKTERRTAISRGDGTFTFTAGPAPRPAGLPAAIVAELDALEQDITPANRFAGPLFWEGDLNGDGRPDVVISYYAAYGDQAHLFGRYLLRQADGTFSAIAGISGVPDLPPRDLNGDGRLDLLTTHASTAGLYYQQADGSFRLSGGPVDSFVRPIVTYPYEVRYGDLDRDGDIDLLISSGRSGQAKVFEQTAPGTYTLVLTAHHWDAEGFDLGDVDGDGDLDLVVGGYGGVPPETEDITIYLNVSNTTGTSPTNRVPPIMADTSSPQWTRFVAAVDGSIAGRPFYWYQGWHPALVYRLAPREIYATEAVRLTDAFVASEEALIAAGQNPAVAGNQYLDSGRLIASVAMALDWCGHRATQAQRDRWSAYCQQTIWNIWNPRQAKWGGRNAPWPGWCVLPPQPSNNYYHSFLRATMFWGLASQREEWMTQLRDVNWPAIQGAMATVPEGGSREGTMYGQSHMSLFESYRIWRDAGQPNVGIQKPHTRRSLDYWLHATAPGLTNLAVIGDQADDRKGLLYDYARRLMIEAVNMKPDTPEAQRGRWWLQRCSVPQMTSPFNYAYDCVPITGGQMEPTDTFYSAIGAGHYFWRRDWTATSPYLYLISGLYDEVHACQEQGSFGLWAHGRWQSVHANFWSHTGINQATGFGNVVRFERGGVVIPQKIGRKADLSFVEAKDGTIRAALDLSGFYDQVSWVRWLTFDGTMLEVRDVTDAPADVRAFWQIQLADQPAIDGATLRTPELEIVRVAPAAPWAVSDWRLSQLDLFRGGWRAEVEGRAFKVRIVIR